MITIFNRRELIITMDLKRQAEVRDLLAQNGLDYYVKVISRNSPSLFSSSRARLGTFGENPQLAYTYYIYVHKSDYDRAAAILSGRIR